MLWIIGFLGFSLGISVIILALAHVRGVSSFESISAAQHAMYEDAAERLIRTNDMLRAGMERAMDRALATNDDAREAMRDEIDADVSKAWAENAGKAPPDRRELRPSRNGQVVYADPQVDEDVDRFREFEVGGSTGMGVD